MAASTNHVDEVALEQSKIITPTDALEPNSASQLNTTANDQRCQELQLRIEDLQQDLKVVRRERDIATAELKSLRKQLEAKAEYIDAATDPVVLLQSEPSVKDSSAQTDKARTERVGKSNGSKKQHSSVRYEDN